MRIYLDHNATTPLAPEVAEAIAGALSVWGNPSSIHAEGREARDRVEAARRSVSELLAAEPDEIVFTSGGTEADWLGVLGLARLQSAPVACSAIEHPALGGAAAHSGPVIPLEVDGAGRIDPNIVTRACEAGAQVVAVGLANHELGTLQDVAAISTAAHGAGALVHCDAVQAAGKVSIDVRALGVDTLAVSAHKMGGPKGVGALWVRRGVDLPPLVDAGHQERGRRAGTENLLGIVGFGCAAALAQEQLAAAVHVARLRDGFEAQILELSGSRVHGKEAPRVSNTLNVGFDGALGEVVVAGLDLSGVAVSTGAACTSGTVRASPVLLALGLSEERAKEAVRFSLGPTTTAAELEVVLDVLPDILRRARQFR